jgi:hypothetical protein
VSGSFTTPVFGCRKCGAPVSVGGDDLPPDGLCGWCRASVRAAAAVAAPPAGAEPILQFFAYAHLPPHLAVVSQPFGELAERIVATLPRNPERTVALRKLLESKDAAVRSALFKDPAP